MPFCTSFILSFSPSFFSLFQPAAFPASCCSVLMWPNSLFSLPGSSPCPPSPPPKPCVTHSYSFLLLKYTTSTCILYSQISWWGWEGGGGRGSICRGNGDGVVGRSLRKRMFAGTTLRRRGHWGEGSWRSIERGVIWVSLSIFAGHWGGVVGWTPRNDCRRGTEEGLLQGHRGTVVGGGGTEEGVFKGAPSREQFEGHGGWGSRRSTKEG